MRVKEEKETGDLPEEVSADGDIAKLRSPPTIKQGPPNKDNLVRMDERNRAWST